MMTRFDETFTALTGFAPMPWQAALYSRLMSDRPDHIPRACSLPTGFGKTSVVAIWLIALARRPERLPRRLIYVVNRRTVVDQTTRLVERLRSVLLDPEHHTTAPRDIALLRTFAEDLRRLSANTSVPLAISTLRGQFADNAEWAADPSRPAVICGTVDMIGSRLLFSGYSIGFRSRPLHAGFLGQDALLVHDEAHLEPAFQSLLESIQREQERCNEFTRFHVMELTATTRTGNVDVQAFTLSNADLEHPVAKRRLKAPKRLELTRVESDKQVPARLAEIAAGYADENAPVLVFVRTIESVMLVRDRLVQTGQSVSLLTGTMRGKERDELAETSEFKRFQTNAEDGETVYLVCTSAGEVGVDISARHLVSDLSTFDSMAQRFGRANRYGEFTDTRIDVVYPGALGEVAPSQMDEMDKRRHRTLHFLRALNGDGSPEALGRLSLRRDLPYDMASAFAPEPRILPATDILFDAWALTTIRQRMPGRPPVAPFLHGISEWEPPETYVAWRQEVEAVTGPLLERYSPDGLLDDYPLKPQEVLRDRSDRIFGHLRGLAERHPDKPVWVQDDRGVVTVAVLKELATDVWKKRIQDVTVILPPSVGGLAEGMFVGTSPQAEDVADRASGADARLRVWSDDPDYDAATRNLRRVRSIELDTSEDGESPRRWEWFVAASLEGGRTSRRPVIWETHVNDVVGFAQRVVSSLPLPDEVRHAVVIAARLHDHGKRREQFQITLGNGRYPDVLLAKSGRTGARLPEPFRHEFASLFDCADDPEFGALSDGMKDLILHLIAAHHGRARPHFGVVEAFDTEHPGQQAERVAMEVPRRFARLQRRYGRWGLAYLESLLRAADWAASGAPSAYLDEPKVPR